MNTNQPGAAFGRRGRDNAAVSLVHRAPRPALPVGRIVFLLGLTGLLLTAAGAIFWTLPGIGKANAEAARTEQKVVEIINQPITHLPRSGSFTVFSPGWFHPGATKPDFHNVDIRTTQELTYEGYVTSDLNPTEMFIGRELEFNAMTKYFYTDRTLPKKRLSDTEMVEVNGLYRVIGHDKQAVLMRWLVVSGLAVVGFCLASALFLQISRTRQLLVV
ncbi:hypothetical protein [Mesorhizobium sp. NZP2077]|uniref:hypothetical protein n=1 Tax=Mesorhizobium sp. NZP2077 TaxID=2483404 RepID=UPI0015535128|nr:hypothetical protein [Mesorhizobium sp. NZP2077]QKD13942.1 hypothetical protein HGP13_01825 [Mesorhizobium sp. NZP2077]